MTQVLGLLELAPEVVEAVAVLGDPLPKRIVTEHGLRSVLFRSFAVELGQHWPTAAEDFPMASAISPYGTVHWCCAAGLRS